MTIRRITEEQFESGSAIDGSRIQKALTETEEYFNNIPLEAIKEKYSLNYMVFTSLGSDIGHMAAAPAVPVNQSGYFHYTPFLPVGAENRVKGIFREEREGFDSINDTTGKRSKTYGVFTVSTMFDRPVIIDSVCLFMMNKIPDAVNRPTWWTVFPASGSGTTAIDEVMSNQKYAVLDAGGRSIQRTRILIETDDVVSSEDRTLNSKEFVLQDFQEKFWAPERWASGVAPSTMFPETAESTTGAFMENPTHEGIYLTKQDVNIPIHQKARVRFRVVGYADGLSATVDLWKDIKPENMTLTIVYKEALISG